jgi:ABC-type uncharacterized transport system permease subunit
VLSTLLFALSYLISMKLLTDRVGNIAGYTKDEMFLALLVGEVTFLAGAGCLHDLAYAINKLVNSGGLDFLLLRPFPIRISLSSLYANYFYSFRDGLLPVAVIAVLTDWSKLEISLGRVLLGCAVWVSGYLVLRCLMMALTYPVFVIGESKETISLAYGIYSQLYTPFGPMPASVKLAAHALIPTFLMTGGVVYVLLGKSNYIQLVYSSVFAAFLSVIIYRLLWRSALKRYTSASS